MTRGSQQIMFGLLLCVSVSTQNASALAYIDHASSCAAYEGAFVTGTEDVIFTLQCITTD